MADRKLEDDGGMPVDLHEDGLLWLINRVVFHPRGFALGHERGSRDFFLYGTGEEPWQFMPPDLDDALFAAVEACLDERARLGDPPGGDPIG